MEVGGKLFGRKASNVRLKGFEFSLPELGGALGDLGTLLPLLIALITVTQLSSTSVFLVVGLAYILAGLYYRVPTPVQPLKGVAAIAIALGLSASIVSAAGLVMGLLLLSLAVTGLTRPLAHLFSKPVVRGIQLGVGLLLLKSGLLLATRPQGLPAAQDAVIRIADFLVPIPWLLALGAAIVLISFLKSRRLPASLAVLGFGLGAGALLGFPFELGQLRLGLALPTPALPTASDMASALVLLVIPQLPLTLGNAVFATADTAQAYFGAAARRVTPKGLLTTMGISNLAAGLLGGMGICHGSGGLTAHYKLGARTGGANLMIGTLLLGIAVLVDGNALPLLRLIPFPVLGVMLAFVGFQHALLARDLRQPQHIAVAGVVALTALIFENLALGFAMGIVVHYGLRAFQRLLGGTATS